MKPEWYRPRGYKHFDAPVGENFASRCATNPAFVGAHHWQPLIYYVKRIKRYKPGQAKTIFKDRPIMYASHRDACILAKYAHDLGGKLDSYYEEHELCDKVIAYRKLGKSNYDFSADAYRYCLSNSPCLVLCFDITGFFDNLNHAILKDRLKKALQVSELSDDWYKVFRHVTQFRKINREDLVTHTYSGPRMRCSSLDMI